MKNLTQIVGLPLFLKKEQQVFKKAQAAISLDFLHLALLILPVVPCFDSAYAEYLGMFAVYQQYIVAQFIREFIDPSFGEYELKRNLSKKAKDNIRKIVFLWGKVWVCLLELYPNSIVYVPDYPAKVFLQLVIERQLLFVGVENHTLLLKNWGFSPTTKELCRGRESKRKTVLSDSRERLGYVQQNAILRRIEGNPFDKKYQYTYRFVEQIQEKANQDDSFRTSFYLPMIAARTDLTAFLEGKGMRILNDKPNTKRRRK